MLRVSKSCYTHQHMTERTMGRRYYLSSELSQMGHRQISKCWREKRFSRTDERCNRAGCFLLSANGTATAASNEQGFFNPQLFDLIRPICICSRVMVRMKAAAVIAFSRRNQRPPHLLLPLYCNYSCFLPLQSFAFATNAFVSTALMWDLIK